MLILRNRDLTWKDKILDYEIETWVFGRRGALLSRLEKIRFSITRLKRNGDLFKESILLRPWKDKILDYEIETLSGSRVGLRAKTWKDKILDYEIETKRLIAW